jgi:hypothetical protein
MSNFPEFDMSHIFQKEQVSQEKDFQHSPSLPEKNKNQLADPGTNPIFDIYYNKIEKNLYISGVDYFKSFKIFNYQY